MGRHLLSVMTAALALGCGAPGQSSGSHGLGEASGLRGVDTSSLTTREQQEWSALVSNLLAPCEQLAMTLAQCVENQAPCASCAPAAQVLVDHIKRGRTHKDLQAVFRTRFAPDAIRNVPSEGSPGRGAEAPVVTIVEWANFGCPFCAATANALHALVDKYPGQVRVVFKHYPLAAHRHADLAAKAAVAADRQGKFWLLHDRLFALQGAEVDESTIRQIAEESGVDPQAMARDMQSREVAELLARDRQQGDALELQGTPMLFINGRHFDLQYFDVAQDLEAWVALEIELTAPGATAPPARSPSPKDAGRTDP